VFTILLTSRLGERIQETSRLRKSLAFVFSFLVAILAFSFLKELTVILQNQTEDFATLSAIGKRLLSSDETGFLLPFEAISLLLLISLIGAATIARIPRDDNNEEAK
jgi:NADH-quinone oxidoreductase subunit J